MSLTSENAEPAYKAFQKYLHLEREDGDQWAIVLERQEPVPADDDTEEPAWAELRTSTPTVAVVWYTKYDVLQDGGVLWLEERLGAGEGPSFQAVFYINRPWWRSAARL